jgi:antagonist of KipI
MKIRIKKAGLLSTVQDLGRLHYLSLAVPVSGAMDSLSAQIANIALGNEPNSAVIEFTQSGASFVTETDALLAFSGDGAWLCAGGLRVQSDRPVFIPAGTDLYLENNKKGNVSYLAVAGGWDVPEVLGCKSTYLTAKIGGLEGRCLKENDRLSNIDVLTAVTDSVYDSLRRDTINYPNWNIARSLFLSAERNTIRVMKGREFNWFDADSTDAFLSQSYTIGYNSNRMGYNLHGEILTRVNKGELLSTAVTPGAIQVTNSGELILLMADAQTTGGYPRIAQVAAVDLPLCAQLKPSDTMNFREISWKEAEKLYIQQQLDLRKLAVAIKQKYI